MAKNRTIPTLVPRRTRRPKGAEKWFDALIVAGTDDVRKANPLLGSEHRPRPPLRRRFLPQTARQTALIGEVISVLNEMRADLGLDAVVINPQRFRILPAKVYRRAGRNRESRGFTAKGWTYLNATYCRDEVDLLGILTHEIVHLMSFSVLVLWPRLHGERFTGFFDGFRTFGYRQGDFAAPLWAFNEAITEIIADELRARLVAKGVVRGRNARRLRNWWRTTYIAYLIGFLRLSLGNSAEEVSVAFRTFAIDYFRGTRKFVPILRRLGLLEGLLDLDPIEEDIIAFVTEQAHRLNL